MNDSITKDASELSGLGASSDRGNWRITHLIVAATVLLWLCIAAPLAIAGDDDGGLPSWNDGPSKSAIVEFVGRVTAKGGSAFVPEAERIAVFDNDGTLWAEQPYYFQVAFAFDRVKALASDHPQWQQREPYRSILAGEPSKALAADKHAILEMMAATHTGNTVDEFADVARDWLETARHSTTGARYTEMVYEPMLELLRYLRANGFKTYIVSGGGVEFIRGFSDDVYGIPPEQVVGSSIAVTYQVRSGVPALMREPKLNFINDGPGKPVAINLHIGRRPIMAVGNSDGDFEMLEWVTAGDGARFGMIVHHTDGQREFAYDRDSKIGRLDRALDEAPERDWTIIDMKTDWNRMFAFDNDRKQ